MKKIIYLLMIMMTLPLLVSANTMNNDEPKSTSIRADRQIAITGVSGWNSLAGVGVIGSYYVNPRIGIDAGVGAGLKGGKVGARGRYMFTENNFAPYAGLGLMFSTLNGESVITNEETFEIINYNINRTLFTQLVVGFEFMSNGGFVIGLNAGWAIPLTAPYEVISGELDSISKTALGIAHGGGLATEFSVGYAF